MIVERPPARASSRPVPKLLWWSGAVVLAVLAGGIVLLATHWPFSKESVTKALEEATSRPVEIGSFRQSYFPPGCMAENIRVLHSSREGEPLITIQKLLVHASLTGLFSSPKRLAEVKVVGMRLRIPSKRRGGGSIVLNGGSGGRSLAISKIVADGALLEFEKANPAEKPYTLRVDGLVIKDVGDGDPMAFNAILTNSEPRGVIRAHGKFGPWNPVDEGATPVSGEYTYRDVDLGTFHGIDGILAAKGSFSGKIGRILTDGTVETPNFHVEHSGSSVRLTVDYHGIVNGTNGDVYLEPAKARFLRTPVNVHGAIEDGKQGQGKTATLDLAIPHGRIEDLLRLFVREKASPISGAMSLRAHVVWPPGPPKFLEKIRVDIDFGVDDGRFRSEKTQGLIDRLSKSAEGESRKEEEEDPRTMLSDLRGHVAFRNGIATFQSVTIAAPGASANIRGTYGLIDHLVNLHGVLTTRGKISDAPESAWKGFLVKLISPLIQKKKNDLNIVSFKITGAFDNASVSLD